VNKLILFKNSTWFGEFFL